jgi:hypothetical protein
MGLNQILPLVQTSVELGLITGLTVLALFLSYSMLNVCDLSTDGCFTLGAAVGGIVSLAGYPWLSLPAAMAAGVVSGFITAVLQTRMGINSLLAGIVVNTGLYSVNIAIMGGSSQLNMNRAPSVFTLMKDLLAGRDGRRLDLPGGVCALVSGGIFRLSVKDKKLSGMGSARLLFTAELRTCCAAAASRVTQASAPVHREAIYNDRSAVTIHGQTAVNSNNRCL